MPNPDLLPKDDPKRDPINLDFRILSLVLFCATRADLLQEYLADKSKPDKDRWLTLRQLGLPPRLLEDSFYLFDDPETKGALKQLQRVTQTLVNLNDYCVIDCPASAVLSQICLQNSLQRQPLQEAGVED